PAARRANWTLAVLLGIERIIASAESCCRRAAGEIRLKFTARLAERRMNPSRIEQIVRHFRENGLKLLLENPANARELLGLTATRLLDRMDFARMRVDPTTYIAADYRHIASDLVLNVPFRTGRGRESITVYVLIEHQSEPDSLMGLRVLDYVVQIYKRQVRDQLARDPSRKRVQLEPVLPLVLYTGTVSWPQLPRLVELVQQGDEFGDLIPQIGPLFLNLPEVPSDQLAQSGPLGCVLELIQHRKARPEEFRILVARAVQRLEDLPARERNRWLELLSYIRAMVYHDREDSERDGLRELILKSVSTDARRREVETMFRTGAETLREEGREEGAIAALQQALVNLLRGKFGRLPRATERAIRATQDPGQLDAWLVRAGQATSLSEIEIAPP
ncbi:MAG TPA: Rpn family recombination-promoting nuclease/putative transposase, partial [Pirellulales bacterium]|nr:Rpn family recombination-promoting nuclease/putative transposase [Pirellulales bacterium]